MYPAVAKTNDLAPEVVLDPYPGDDVESVVSDAESECFNAPEARVLFDGLVRLVEGDRVYDLLKKRFFMGLNQQLAAQTFLEAIHRNNFAGALGRAKKESFELFMKAVEEKNRASVNVKYAWYGGNKEDLLNIMQNGFGTQLKNSNDGTYGRGVYFAPDLLPIEGMKDSTVDGDGLRHLLLCRIILGNPEVVLPGSEQCHPSSYEYDSGVDSFTAPRKLIVWSTQVNTHILPEFILSLKAPESLTGFYEVEAPVRPRAFIPFRELFVNLVKFLPRSAAIAISNHYKDHKETRITRQELMRLVRQIAGDKLVVLAILEFRNQVIRARNLRTNRN